MKRKDVVENITKLGYVQNRIIENVNYFFTKGNIMLAYFKPIVNECDHVIALETRKEFTKWSEARVLTSFTDINQIREIVSSAEKKFAE